jgi:hypothetical protein
LDSGSGGNDDVAGAGGAPEWVPQFLAGLIVTGSVKQAVAEAGIDFDTAWALRRTEPAFAYYWDRAALVNEGLSLGLNFDEAVAIVEGADGWAKTVH